MTSPKYIQQNNQSSDAIYPFPASRKVNNYRKFFKGRKVEIKMELIFRVSMISLRSMNEFVEDEKFL